MNQKSTNCVICGSEILFRDIQFLDQEENEMYSCCKKAYTCVVNNFSKAFVSEYIRTTNYLITYYHYTDGFSIYDYRKAKTIYSTIMRLDRIPNVSSTESIKNFLLLQ